MKLFVGIRKNRKNALFVRNISDFQIFPPCLILKSMMANLKKNQKVINEKVEEFINSNPLYDSGQHYIKTKK